MTPTEKIWGTTEALIVTPMFEMHRLVIAPQMRCSLHEHQFKHNAFYILRGELFLDISNRDETVRASRRISQNQWATIRPGFYHQFRTGLIPCMALEIYHTEPLSEDIRRLNTGGPVCNGEA